MVLNSFLESINICLCFETFLKTGMAQTNEILFRVRQLCQYHGCRWPRPIVGNQASAATVSISLARNISMSEPEMHFISPSPIDVLQISILKSINIKSAVLSKKLTNHSFRKRAFPCGHSSSSQLFPLADLLSCKCHTDRIENYIRQSNSYGLSHPGNKRVCFHQSFHNTLEDKPHMQIIKIYHVVRKSLIR